MLPTSTFAKRLQAHCPYVEAAMWRPSKGTPTEIERADVGGHQRLHQSTRTRLADRRRDESATIDHLPSMVTAFDRVPEPMKYTLSRLPVERFQVKAPSPSTGRVTTP